MTEHQEITRWLERTEATDWPPTRSAVELRGAADQRARHRAWLTVAASATAAAVVITGAVTLATASGSHRVRPARPSIPSACRSAASAGRPVTVHAPTDPAVAANQLLQPSDFGAGWSATPALPPGSALSTIASSGVTPVGATASMLLQRGAPPEWQINQTALSYATAQQSRAAFNALRQQALCQVQLSSTATARAVPRSHVIINRDNPAGSLFATAGAPMPLGYAQTVWSFLTVQARIVTSTDVIADVPLDGTHGPAISDADANRLAAAIWSRLTTGTTAGVALPTKTVPVPPAQAMLRARDIGAGWRSASGSVTSFSGFIDTLPVEPTEPARRCPAGPTLPAYARRGQTYTGPLPPLGQRSTLVEGVSLLSPGQAGQFRAAVRNVIDHQCADIRAHATQTSNAGTITTIIFATPSHNHTTYDQAFAITANTLITLAVHTTHSTDRTWLPNVLQTAIQRQAAHPSG